MTNPTDCSRVVEALGNATVYAETVQAVADPTEKECTSSGVCCLAIECSNSKFVGDSMTKKAAAAMLVPTGIILFLLAFSTAIPQKMAAKQYVIENPAPDKNP